MNAVLCGVQYFFLNHKTRPIKSDTLTEMSVSVCDTYYVFIPSKV